MTDSKFLKISSCAIVLISCLAGLLYCALNPIWNWDVLGYAASVESLTENDVNVIHANVYTALKDSVPENVWNELTNSTQYRTVMHDDAEAFAQQIPYYKIRILFILLMFAMSKLGIELIHTAHILAATFFSIGTMIFYLSLRKFVHSFLWLLFPVIMFVFTHELEVTQKALVDNFSFFWIALVVYAFVNKRPWLYLLVATLVLVRTDLILLSALIFMFSWFIEPVHRIKIILWGTVSAALYLVLNNWAGNYGWQTLFYFVFVTDMSATHPEQFTTYQLTIAEYLKHLIIPRWGGAPIYLAYLLFCANTLLYVFLASQQQKAMGTPHEHERQFRAFLLSCISGAYIASHYLLFPLMESRFFIGSYASIGVGFLSLGNDALAHSKKKAYTSETSEERYFSQPANH